LKSKTDHLINARFAGDTVTKLLVGNKCDLDDARKVSYEEGAELAKHFDIPFMETSAKSSVNVEETFITMTREIKKSKANQAKGGDRKKSMKFGSGNFLSEQ
jgi:GTPase SAR1 family protein